MYGLIGRVTAVGGRRAELAKILTEATRDMPGCQSYVVATDFEDPNVIWITEVWQDEAAHRHSLTTPEVQAAIAKGKPLIADMERVAVTHPDPRTAPPPPIAE